eukprot:TRINITY_DN4760_c0_g2_i1.p1 TRINITY_DN4760_c0_g2~~TRINITY_DN4760_c0_g2_i1.p1  ORF type:complete len:768 (+),score=267.84 TRINITY_DN4760_c0_g2_i1:111-2414(+)
MRGSPTARGAWSASPPSPKANANTARAVSPLPRSPTGTASSMRRRMSGRSESPSPSPSLSPNHSAYKMSSFRHNNAEKNGEGGGKISVYVRVRPFLQREVEWCEQVYPGKKPRSMVKVEGNNVLVEDNDPSQDSKVRHHEFEVDGVLWSCVGHDPSPNSPGPVSIADQQEVYQAVGKGSLDAALDSYNATIFAYGSTGSGKTYTMMGDEQNPGIATHLMKELFVRASLTGDHCDVEVTFLEIYNEMVRDLLRRNGDYIKNARIRQHPVHNMTYVDLGKETPLTAKKVTTFSECVKLMETGLAHRSTAETKLNATSSRSHALFQIYLKRTCLETGVLKSSVINIVDLAGSERVKLSGAEGTQLAEATAINLSLTNLRRVIDVLISNAQHKTRMFPPYRDSLLTQVLRESLGGNARTTIIGCVSPWEGSVTDTRSTLNYAARARSVVCHAVRNEQPTEKLVESLRRKVAHLQACLRGEAVSSPMSDGLAEASDRSDAHGSPTALREQLESQVQLLKQMELEIRCLKEEKEKEKDDKRVLSVRLDRFQADARAVTELMDTIKTKDHAIVELEARVKALAQQCSSEKEELRREYFAEKQKRMFLEREYELKQEIANACTCKILKYEVRNLKEALSREIATSRALKEEVESKTVNGTGQLKILEGHIEALTTDLSTARGERDHYKKQFLALQKIYDAECGIIEVMCRAPSGSVERSRTRSAHLPDRTPLRESPRRASPSPAQPLPPPGSPGSADHVDAVRTFRTGSATPKRS